MQIPGRYLKRLFGVKRLCEEIHNCSEELVQILENHNKDGAIPQLETAIAKICPFPYSTDNRFGNKASS